MIRMKMLPATTARLAVPFALVATLLAGAMPMPAAAAEGVANTEAEDMRPASSVALEASRQTVIAGQTGVYLTATFAGMPAGRWVYDPDTDTSDIVFDEITFRYADDRSRIIARVPVHYLFDNVLETAWDGSAGTYAVTKWVTLKWVGSHRVEATYSGDEQHLPSVSASLPVLVKPDLAVSVSDVRAGPSTFHPIRDGYRDLLRISGTRNESASVAIHITDARGRTVRRLSVRTAPGRYSLTWNGLRDGGGLAYSGRYRVRQVFRDWAGNVKAVDTWITLSRRAW